MKSILIILSLCLLSTSSIAESEVKKQISKWEEDAALYKGELKDLTSPSKRAIVTGNLDFAVKPYLQAYKMAKEQMGEESLYQIFLIYTDKTNEKRDPIKAEEYFQLLKKEFPDSKRAEDAAKIHAKYNS